jgi:hypothetical protein
MLIADWEPETDRLIPPGTAAAIFDEIDSLRAEVVDLQERLAFTERLIGQAARTELPEGVFLDAGS